MSQIRNRFCTKTAVLAKRVEMLLHALPFGAQLVQRDMLETTELLMLVIGQAKE